MKIKMIGRFSRKLSCVIFGIFLSLFAIPAHAMNWCAIPNLVPVQESDFDGIANRVELETGCKRKASDSAHNATWICTDDDSTNEFDAVIISLLRIPGDSTTLLVYSDGNGMLSNVSNCNRARYTIKSLFVPGNLIARGSIDLGYRKGVLHYLSRGRGLGGLIYSTPTTYADSNTKSVTKAFGGYTPKPYPATRIRIAGKNIIDSSAEDILLEIQKRGGKILTQSGDDFDDNIWEISPMIGMKGVSQISMIGYLQHVFSVTYKFESIENLKEYIKILDSEYGESRPFQSSGCTVRIWESGDASIHSNSCPGKAPELNIYNGLIMDQTAALDEKLKLLAQERPSASQPSIDRDNF